jgi:hypothetical protein
MFVLLFAVLLFTPIHAQHADVKMVVNYRSQSHNRDFKENKSHHDFSHNSTWGNAHFDRLPTYQNQFNTYTANDFQKHFTAHGYTENQIVNQRCLYMFDEFVKFAQTYSSYKCTIQQLHAELKNLVWYQKAYYMTKGSYCVGLQKRIQFLYNQLSSIKTVQHNNDIPYISAAEYKKYREQTTKNNYSLAAFHKQLPEYNTLDLTYRTYAPSLSDAIEKRVEAYNSMSNIDVTYATNTYNLNNNVKQLLHKYGHDTAQFTQCFGTQLDHAIHHESLNILDRVGCLPPNSILYDHQEALVDFAITIVDYNHEGLTDKAMNVADLCWTLLDYGQAIAEGAALGAYSAVTDILNNPIEATLSIVASKPLLAYQLSKVLYNVADIGLTAVTDGDHAKDKWNNYTEPLNNIINAINKKEISLRDAIKGGTTFAVGLIVQSKLLGGLGKFYNTIKQKRITFAKNNPLLKPQEYLTTPEGLLFKTTTKSNTLKQSGQINAASSLKNNVENKLSKNKSIKGLIKQEGLPTKGKLRYVPPKKLHSFDRLPHEKLPGRKIGFIDRFGNLWVKGESRTKGQPYEWDVQLSKQGIQQVGWMTRDNSHLNVSLDGRVTHK